MTPADFRDLFSTLSDLELMQVSLRENSTPYVFESDEGAWRLFRDQLADNLKVSSDDIAIIGSGRFGFSLKPENNLRVYTESSDVDVVIVSEKIYDELWVNLLNGAYPRNLPESKTIRSLQKTAYTGYLCPKDIRFDRSIFGEKITPVLKSKAHIFDALQGAGRNIKRSFVSINSRVYRTWSHAEMYHLDSIASLRTTMGR